MLLSAIVDPVTVGYRCHDAPHNKRSVTRDLLRPEASLFLA
jgi:hypothetical protein